MAILFLTVLKIVLSSYLHALKMWKNKRESKVDLYTHSAESLL